MIHMGENGRGRGRRDRDGQSASVGKRECKERYLKEDCKSYHRLHLCSHFGRCFLPGDHSS